MIELFNYMRKLYLYLFGYISSKMLPCQTTEVFEYWCVIEFVYAYQVNTS